MTVTPSPIETIYDRARRILSDVKYRDWIFEVIRSNEFEANPPTILRARFTDPDDNREWTTRKWLLSEHMTDSEIVQTAFKCVMTAEEHEVREKFFFLGKPIFGPHYDVHKLHELCNTDDHLDAR